MKTDTALLGSLTIPGQAEHVAEARAFVSRILGADCAEADTVILLTSELVTNSIQHSRSGRDGGTITITLIAVPDGIRAEVVDEGGPTNPMLSCGRAEPADLTENGRGLQLVQMLSARWSYAHDEAGTVTWFELATPARQA
jgi:anti-sigma regulatory factor (Ser/Thr protein kinase)